MNIFDKYAKKQHAELTALFNAASQQHPHGLPACYLEKDVWVTEILRLLFDEKLLGDCSVAFKGGTALSKCWNAINRFSEDIDLSIHWADLSGHTEEQEEAAWQASIANKSQASKFRKQQGEKLRGWTADLLDRLNQRLAVYKIEGLYAEFELDKDGRASGEKIDIHFPRTTQSGNDYQLDHILLEFGGRNRGKPTTGILIETYIANIPGLESLGLPKATVMAYHQEYILWEKLTALHQFSTQEHDPNPARLARHWYDVDCILTAQFADPYDSQQAMDDVITMKQARWSMRGVDFEQVAQGGLKLVPEGNRLDEIRKDHDDATSGGMFYDQPDKFDAIITRLTTFQTDFNRTTGKS